MADLVKEWWKSIVLFSFALKFLLIQTYHSTDFEVHRNWLAITHSLPISQWYYEATSQWTLDYPPLFAWFEFILSQVAVVVDPQMVMVNNLEYASTKTVLFQRLSVIFTDLLLAYAIKEYCSYLFSQPAQRKTVKQSLNGLIVVLLVIFNFGLLIVDHIHFQYNGFLFGILLLSITRTSEHLKYVNKTLSTGDRDMDECLDIDCQGRVLEGSFWFSLLLNFKHLFLYIAPAYFVYLLRTYCFRPSGEQKKEKQLILFGVNLWDFSPVNLLKLGFVVLSVFAISFGPFIAMGQLPQVLSRLFPFKRGLCHAYWAPNFWALYNVLDKFITVTGISSGYLSKDIVSKTAAMTGGLIGQSEHMVLPSVPPMVTVVLTLLSILPALMTLWFRPSGARGFLRCLVLCGYGSFLFGWHVHEKAVLILIVPLSLLAIENKRDARVFLILSTSGHLSLFPLLFRPEETPIKACLLLMFTVFAFYSLCLVHCGKSTKKSSIADLFTLPVVEWYEALNLYILLALQFFCVAVYPWLGLATKLPFLPLLVTSVVCAVGIIWCWVLFYYDTLRLDGLRYQKEAKKIR